jgi:hypothetical protein
VPASARESWADRRFRHEHKTRCPHWHFLQSGVSCIWVRAIETEAARRPVESCRGLETSKMKKVQGPACTITQFCRPVAAYYRKRWPIDDCRFLMCNGMLVPTERHINNRKSTIINLTYSPLTRGFLSPGPGWFVCHQIIVCPHVIMSWSDAKL